MRKLKLLPILLVLLFAYACSTEKDDPLEGWTGRQDPEPDPDSEPDSDAPMPIEVNNRVAAHRGGASESGNPDNSRAGLQYAISLECYAAECDFYITSDNEIIMAHADNGHEVNGLTPYEHTLAEIRAAGTLTNGETIPTLQEFLEIALEGGCTKLLMDVKNIQFDGNSTKTSRDYAARSAERACEIIKEMNAANFVEFTCTSSTNATNDGRIIMERVYIAATAIGCPAAWVNFTDPTTYLSYGFPWANVDGTEIYSKGVYQNPKYKIEDYLNAGLEFSVYYVDTEADMDCFYPYKDDLRCVTTDYPAKLLEKWY